MVFCKVKTESLSAFDRGFREFCRGFTEASSGTPLKKEPLSALYRGFLVFCRILIP